jgi:hypothetical protein
MPPQYKSMKLGDNFKKAMQDVFDGGYMHASTTEDMRPEALLLNPEWWSALGKARGWKRLDAMCYSWCDHDGNVKKEWRSIRRWKNYLHRFIDHIAEGKDAESFFKEMV